MPKIMLAEDDATMLSLLKTLLGMEGFQTVALHESDDLAEAIQRENPDVILMDIHMPQGNGLDMLRDLRTHPELKNTVVIMSSGMNLEAESMQAGANAFILKPYMPDTLINTIRKHA